MNGATSAWQGQYIVKAPSAARGRDAVTALASNLRHTSDRGRGAVATHCPHRRRKALPLLEGDQAAGLLPAVEPPGVLDDESRLTLLDATAVAAPFESSRTAGYHAAVGGRGFAPARPVQAGRTDTNECLTAGWEANHRFMPTAFETFGGRPPPFRPQRPPGWVPYARICVQPRGSGGYPPDAGPGDHPVRPGAAPRGRCKAALQVARTAACLARVAVEPSFFPFLLV